MCKRPQNFLFTPETRKEVCVNKHPGYSFAVATDMKCMETKVKLKSPFSLPLLQECWKQITGVEPKEDTDYTEVYCRDESPYILVNMVHDCFLLRFVKDHVETMDKNKTENSTRMKMVNDLYRGIDMNKCFGNFLPQYQYHYPKSFISEFVSCMDRGSNIYKRFDAMDLVEDLIEGFTFRSARKYFESVYELENPVIAKERSRDYCQADGTKKISQNIRCLKQKMEGNETILNKCFKDITLTSPYPTSDNEIKSYLCDGDNQIAYPLALMKKIELCVNKELNHGLCFTEELLKKSGENEYYSMLPESSLEITFYNQICLLKNMTAFKEMIVGDIVPWYNALVCTAQKFNKESRVKSNVGNVINYCWNYLMSHGQFLNSTMKEIPNSDEEWMKFYCSHEYYNKRMMLPSFEPVNSCMERMLRLDSRSVVQGKSMSNPRRSPDEETLMKCLRMRDFRKVLYSFTEDEDEDGGEDKD